MPPVYAMTRKLDAEIGALDPEAIEEYSLTLGLLLKFIQALVKLRITDVGERRYNFAVARREREQAIQAAEELAQRRESYLEEEKAKYQADLENAPED